MEGVVENTCSAGISRNDKGQFIPGISGNPNGTSVGAKKKLNKIVEAFADVFEGLGGKDGFQTWAINHKETFYRMILQLLPKEMKIEQEGGDTHIHISPEKILIFKDINVKYDGRADSIHVPEGAECNRQ
jgi:hypothetical protein